MLLGTAHGIPATSVASVGVRGNVRIGGGEQLYAESHKTDRIGGPSQDAPPKPATESQFRGKNPAGVARKDGPGKTQTERKGSHFRPGGEKKGTHSGKTSP